MTSPSRIIIGDVIDGLRTLDAGSVQCCVTSPPYWGLRDYGVGGQIGLEKTPEEFVAKMVDVFREVRRVLELLVKGVTLTPDNARAIGVTRLAARINDLRNHGFKIIGKRDPATKCSAYWMERTCGS